MTSPRVRAPKWVAPPTDGAELHDEKACWVCKNPQREVVERMFLQWFSLGVLARYAQEEPSAVHEQDVKAHMAAFGLTTIRLANLEAGLVGVVERELRFHQTGAAVNADMFLGCIDRLLRVQAARVRKPDGRTAANKARALASREPTFEEKLRSGKKA